MTVRRTAVLLVLLLGAATGCADDEARPAAAETSRPAETGGRLSYDQILERCLPQLRRHWRQRLRVPPTADNTVVRNLQVDHRVGDLASFSHAPDVGFSDGWEVDQTLCRIPAAGDEDDPVDPAGFLPRPDDIDQLRALCTEADGTLGAAGYADVDNVDLRRARVTAKAASGRLVRLVLEQPNLGLDYLCTLGVSGNTLASAELDRRQIVATGVDGRRGLDDLYTGAGFTSPRVRRLEISNGRGVVRTVRVRSTWVFGTHRSVYAFFVSFPRDRRYGDLRVRVLDRDGRLLWRQRWANLRSQTGH